MFEIPENVFIVQSPSLPPVEDTIIALLKTLPLSTLRAIIQQARREAEAGDEIAQRWMLNYGALFENR